MKRVLLGQMKHTSSPGRWSSISHGHGYGLHELKQNTQPTGAHSPWLISLYVLMMVNNAFAGGIKDRAQVEGSECKLPQD